ncbi:unannotated protein [freshwater metagenome]|uniref:Unannotated protein n=1 Tax=freshwater metagenome TaxID=449393 RepID=A0A6J6EI66_9ZZZZ
MSLVPAQPNAPALPPDVLSELQKLADRAGQLQLHAHSPNTIARYQQQWQRFVAWCETRSIPVALPIQPELIALYLTHWSEEPEPPAYSTLNQAVCAIGWVHSTNGVAQPSSITLDRLLRGLRRTIGVAPRRQATPLRLDHLRRIGDALLAHTKAQHRDAALLALRRSGLGYGTIASLDLANVVELTRSKCVIRREDLEVTLKRAAEHCPVRAIAEWLDVRGGWPGPLLTRITPTDEIDHRAIARQSVQTILKRHASVQNVAWPTDGVFSEKQHDVLAEAIARRRPSRLRDHALLLTLWAFGLRSDELANLRIRDVRIDQRGMTLSIRRSKTDQEGVGKEKVCPRGHAPATDPVRAMESWLAVLKEANADPRTPVCVAIDRHDVLTVSELDESGNVQPASPLPATTITRILRQALLLAGMKEDEIADFSSHSGKRGVATELAHAGADIRSIADVTGHKSLEMARRYVDEVERWDQSPLRKLSL